MINISSLNKKEVKICTEYFAALGKLAELSPSSLDKVLWRLQLLHVVNDEEEQVLRKQLRRIS